MDEFTRLEARNATQRRRRPPGSATRVLVAADGEGRLPDEIDPGPIELAIEATLPDGQLAPWLYDDWWADTIARWAGRQVTVQFAPTPGALLQPSVLYQLEMLRRVVPRWRLVAFAYPGEIVSDQEVEHLAASGYHEVRFFDAPRSDQQGSKNSASSPSRLAQTRQTRTIEELFGQLRRAQARAGTNRPVWVRLPAEARSGAAQTHAAALSRVAVFGPIGDTPHPRATNTDWVPIEPT